MQRRGVAYDWRVDCMQEDRSLEPMTSALPVRMFAQPQPGDVGHNRTNTQNSYITMDAAAACCEPYNRHSTDLQNLAVSRVKD